MSFDTDSSDSCHVITLQIPSSLLAYPRSSSPIDIDTLNPQSSSSSLSRNSIYISPQVARSHSSAAINLNVKFAPLPELAPRKRRSTVPLGIAARGRLMRRQRAGYDENGDPIPHYQPLWTAEDLDRQRRAEGMGDDLGIEDPFAAIGKLMRVATRKVWKRVAKKGPGVVDGSESDTLDEMDVEKGDHGHGRGATSEDGVEWEKEQEEGKEYLWSIGQTETIRNGGRYSWPKRDDASRVTKSEDCRAG